MSSNVTELRPNAGTCDWGGCDEPSVAFRRSPDTGDMLPVCGEHDRTVEGARVDLAHYLHGVLCNHIIVTWGTPDPDRNTVSCDGEDCDWEEPDEAQFEYADEASNFHLAEMLATALADPEGRQLLQAYLDRKQVS